MTKPSNFTMNSDYLSLAQTDTNKLTAYFPGEHFNAGSQYTRTQDFTVSSSKGAIDIFMISLNGSDYSLGASLLDKSIGTDWQHQSSSIYLRFMVKRIDASTIRVQLFEFTNQAGGYDMPMQTVAVKVASFKPPNLF